MAGYQCAHSSQYIQTLSSIAPCSSYAWCTDVMQSVPECGTVCRKRIVINAGYVF